MWSPLSRQTPADLHIAFHERPGSAQRWEAMSDDERAPWLAWLHDGPPSYRDASMLGRCCYLADVLQDGPLPEGMTPGTGYDASG